MRHGLDGASRVGRSPGPAKADIGHLAAQGQIDPDTFVQQSGVLQDSRYMVAHHIHADLLHRHFIEQHMAGAGRIEAEQYLH